MNRLKGVGMRLLYLNGAQIFGIELACSKNHAMPDSSNEEHFHDATA